MVPAAPLAPSGALAAPPSAAPLLGPPATAVAPVHPDTVPAGRTAYTGHFYAGAQYEGADLSATDLSTEIEVPADDAEANGAFYYVLMSDWDDGGSYDQLGFTNSNGTWGLAYSWTSPCAASYNYDANVLSLTPGTDYVFSMSFDAQQELVFAVTPAAESTPVWTYTTDTGGSAFTIQNTYTCGSGTSLDYTDYEEVYSTPGPVPPYEFTFANNSIDGAPASGLTAWNSSAPAPVRETVSGANATVLNVPFDLLAPPTLLAEAGPSPRSYAATIAVDRFSASSALRSSVVGSVPGGTVALLPSSGSAPFNLTLEVNLTSLTPGNTTAVLEIEVTDTLSVYARTRVVVDIVPTLAARTPVATPPRADVGETVEFSESPSGGNGNVTYLWSGLPAGCGGGTSVIDCPITAAANLSVQVEVADSFGFTSLSAPLLLNVNPRLVLSVVPDVPGNATDVGRALTFDAEITGGTTLASPVVWTAAASLGCVVSHTAPSVLCTFDAAGTFDINASVSDLSGATARGSFAITVDPLPEIELTTSGGPLEAGGTVNISAVPIAGLPPVNYSWGGNISGCLVIDVGRLACTFAAAGMPEVSVRATDANGGSTTAHIVLEVLARPTVVLEADPSNALAGAPVMLQALVSGGDGPFAVTWGGLPPGCSAADNLTLRCAAGPAGTYRIAVAITDHLGSHAEANATLTVAPSLLGLPQDVAGGLLALPFVIGAVGAVLAVRRARRRRSATEEPEPTLPPEF